MRNSTTTIQRRFTLAAAVAAAVALGVMGGPANASTMTPATLDFGTKVVGSATSCSPSGVLAATVHVDGNEKIQSIDTFAAHNTDPKDFFMELGCDRSASGPCQTGMVGPATCTVAVMFDPQSAGAKTGTLQLQYQLADGHSFTSLVTSLTGNATSAPPPAVPEAPSAVLLPLAGAAVVGLVVIGRRRRADRPQIG